MLSAKCEDKEQRRSAVLARNKAQSALWEHNTLEQAGPGARTPDDVVARTQAKYIEAFRRLTGNSLEL